MSIAIIKKRVRITKNNGDVAICAIPSHVEVLKVQGYPSPSLPGLS